MIILVEERVVVCEGNEGESGRMYERRDGRSEHTKREKREERKEKGKTQTSCGNVPLVLSEMRGCNNARAQTTYLFQFVSFYSTDQRQEENENVQRRKSSYTRDDRLHQHRPRRPKALSGATGRREHREIQSPSDP